MTEKKEAASWTNVGSSVAMTQSWGAIESTGDGKVGTLEVTHSFKGSYYSYPADCHNGGSLMEEGHVFQFDKKQETQSF